MNDEKMKIYDTWCFGCNRCFICDGEYRHSKVITQYEDGLEEVELRYIHSKCAKTQKKVSKLKERLLDAEFELFALKFGN